MSMGGYSEEREEGRLCPLLRNKRRLGGERQPKRLLGKLNVCRASGVRNLCASAEGSVGKRAEGLPGGGGTSLLRYLPFLRVRRGAGSSSSAMNS